MAHGIDTAVKAAYPASSNPFGNPSITESDIDQLTTRNHAPLPLREPSQEW